MAGQFSERWGQLAGLLFDTRKPDCGVPTSYMLVTVDRFLGMLLNNEVHEEVDLELMADALEHVKRTLGEDIVATARALMLEESLQACRARLRSLSEGASDPGASPEVAVQQFVATCAAAEQSDDDDDLIASSLAVLAGLLRWDDKLARRQQMLVPRVSVFVALNLAHSVSTLEGAQDELLQHACAVLGLAPMRVLGVEEFTDAYRALLHIWKVASLGSVALQRACRLSLATLINSCTAELGSTKPRDGEDSDGLSGVQFSSIHAQCALALLEVPQEVDESLAQSGFQILTAALSRRSGNAPFLTTYYDALRRLACLVQNPAPAYRVFVAFLHDGYCDDETIATLTGIVAADSGRSLVFDHAPLMEVFEGIVYTLGKHLDDFDNAMPSLSQLVACLRALLTYSDDFTRELTKGDLLMNTVQRLCILLHRDTCTTPAAGAAIRVLSILCDLHPELLQFVNEPLSHVILDAVPRWLRPLTQANDVQLLEAWRLDGNLWRLSGRAHNIGCFMLMRALCKGRPEHNTKVMKHLSDAGFMAWPRKPGLGFRDLEAVFKSLNKLREAAAAEAAAASLLEEEEREKEAAAAALALRRARAARKKQNRAAARRGTAGTGEASGSAPGDVLDTSPAMPPSEPLPPPQAPASPPPPPSLSPPPPLPPPLRSPPPPSVPAATVVQNQPPLTPPAPAWTPLAPPQQPSVPSEARAAPAPPRRAPPPYRPPPSALALAESDGAATSRSFLPPASSAAASSQQPASAGPTADDVAALRCALDALTAESGALSRQVAALTRENAALLEERDCCLCLSAPRCVVLLPCKHLALCDAPACAAMLGGAPRRCPPCREAVADTLTVFRG